MGKPKDGPIIGRKSKWGVKNWFYLVIHLARGYHAMLVHRLGRNWWCGRDGSSRGKPSGRRGVVPGPTGRRWLWEDGRPGENNGCEKADLMEGEWRHSLPVAHIFLLK